MSYGRGQRAALEATRSRGFRAAGRHSARVVFLRRLILAVSAIGIVALFWIGLFNPFGEVTHDVSISAANLDGTRVTMEHPRLTGFRKDGRPYEVRARSGVQDVRKPNVIELNDLSAKIGMTDKSVVRVESPRGVYDSTREFMDFKGDVSIKSDSGYDISLKSAQMDFKAGTVVSDKPVRVVMTSGTVHADRLDITDSGRVITFEGNVRSTLIPQKGTDAPEPDAPENEVKGEAQ